MGVAAGDFNNDGCVDLYLTNFGSAQMFRNNCDGTFTDVTKQSGTDNPGWSVSAAFVDFDRDGWLDLYVGNYLRYSLDGQHIACTSSSGAPDYCTPKSYQPLPDRLYRNQHDGTFADVSARAGIAREFGPALGIATADFNGDGWIDIYVANDGKDNQLWINQRNGTFTNTALLSGAALTAEGKAEASMGVDAGDFDNDGDEDLFMTELTGEGANLYVNDGTGTFDDRSMRSGLGAATLPYTGFGTAWFDVDNDGLAGHPDGQRRRADDPGAGTGARPVSAAPAKTAVPQSRRRAVRGRDGAGRRGVPALGGGPRRGVRRHRQRRRRRRGGGQQQRADAAAHQQRRQPRALARVAADSDDARQ